MVAHDILMKMSHDVFGAFASEGPSPEEDRPMLCTRCGRRRATFRFAGPHGPCNEDRLMCASCANVPSAGRSLDAPFGFPNADALVGPADGPMLHPRLHDDRGRVPATEFLTDAARGHLETAAVLAAEHGSPDVRPEHLLISLTNDPGLHDLFAVRLGASPTPLREAILAATPRGDALPGPEAIRLSARLKRVLQLAHDQALAGGAGMVDPARLVQGLIAEGGSFAAHLLAEAARGARPTGTPARIPHAHDLTALARRGRLDPVIGRDDEIEGVVRILGRRTKHHPVLIGEPGVGKTAIVEGLAQRIAAGEVPDALLGKAVLSLDVAGLVASAHDPTALEGRLLKLVEALEADGEAVLFIEDLDTLSDAGGAGAEALTAALVHGGLRAVVATTLDGYRRRIERYPVLARRCQPMFVEEPSAERSTEILRGLKDLYEAHHAVRVEDAALVAAVALTDRHLPARCLPDKALDALDEACATKHMASARPPATVRSLGNELRRAVRAKEAAVREEAFAWAQELKQRIAALEDEHRSALEAWRAEIGRTEPAVTADDVAAVVAAWTGLPAARLAAEEHERLRALEGHLRRRVIGQEEAVRAVAEAVGRARSGLRDPERPLASFLFVGPAGVGKSALAEALAEYLFGDASAVARFDLGVHPAPDADRIAEALRRRPHRVLLFEALEEAPAAFFDLLLPLLEGHPLRESGGRTLDARHAVVVMTSGAGATRLDELEAQGAGWTAIEGAAMAALQARFRPAFLERVEEIVLFHPLDPAQVQGIVGPMLEATRRQLHAQRVTLVVSPEAEAALAERGFDPVYGARPLRRVIRRELERPIGQMLLDGTVAPGSTLRVGWSDGGFTFSGDEIGASSN